MNQITEGHIVHAYDGELSQLCEMVLEMGKKVVEQVGKAVKALNTSDHELARRVVEQDRHIDQLDMRADEDILRVLALRQPMATDLRLVLALSKAVNELASAGNKAKKIARFAAVLSADDLRKPNRKLLRHVYLMKERACDMLERSLAALAGMDVSAAVEIVKEDDELDEEFEAGMRHLSTFILEDSSAIRRVLDMVFVLKALERVGDHANRIAEQVIFVSEGRDVRYLSPEILGGLEQGESN